MNRFRKLSFQLAALILLATLAASSFAQVTAGNVRGIVRDPTGAVVEGATVTITDPAKQTTNTATTTSSGGFEFRNLLPGTYGLNVSAPNFGPLELKDVRVQLNRTTDIPVQLQV